MYSLENEFPRETLIARDDRCIKRRYVNFELSSLSQQIVETCSHKMSDSETATFSGIGVQISGKTPGGEQAEEQFSLFRAYFDSKLDHLKNEIISESQASEPAKKTKV